MANNLTGDYEAVLQVSIRQINGILATMHQSRIDRDTSPSFAHDGAIRIGDVPPWRELEPSRFAGWVSTMVPDAGVAADSIVAARDALMPRTPPGVTGRLVDALGVIDVNRVEGFTTGRVQGLAEFQLSNPTISVAPGSVSEVTVHADVRARFIPDPRAQSLPQPIHGGVSALYTIAPAVLPDGRKVLRVQLMSDDNQITFASKAPLLAKDLNTITTQVRAAMRKHFVPLDVALPDEFAFSDFSALGSGTTEAVVLPLQLSGAPAPAAGVTSLTNHFIGRNEFAIAIGKDYIERFTTALMNSIRTAVNAIRIHVDFGLFDTVYTASVASLAVAWKPGVLEVSGTINLTTRSVAPNGFVSFRQDVSVVLDPQTQIVSVVPAGNPAVNESWFIPHSRAVNEVVRARDSALPGASRSINGAFDGARASLNRALASFDKWSSATYKTLDLTVDGIIVRGSIATRFRYDPVVSYEAIDGGFAFSAALSWVPAGRIDRFDWTFVERKHALSWRNHATHIPFEHDYTCPKPPDVADIRGICLSIEGTRLTPDGTDEGVVAGTTCSNAQHEPMLVLPSWWMEIFIAEWLPLPPDDRRLIDMVTGHTNMVGEPRGPRHRTANTIVHFAGRDFERPLEGLSRALTQMRRRDVPPLSVLVLPQGAFNARRSDVEARLGDAVEDLKGRLVITEDFARGWTTAFAAGEGPSTHVIDGTGKFVWRSEGRIDAGALARAYDELAIDAPPPQLVMLRLNVRPGRAALDCEMTDDRGARMSLRRLRGRRVILAFWKSWSAPCLSELQRLQQMDAGPDGRFVVAVNGGESRETIAGIRSSQGLTFPLIHDPDQAIATMYGVRCWPTTVSINEEGIVDRVQFGMSHEHPAVPPAPRDEPAYS